MSYRDLPPEVIDAIAALGFSVYMPADGAKTYLFFTDGTNIGYLERGDWGYPAMTYEQFITHARTQQAAYIASERERYAKARALCDQYARDMAVLGLHPLNRMEIACRLSELDRMERDLPVEYGDTPAMRGAWEIQS